jgi:hypothetical protein
MLRMTAATRFPLLAERRHREHIQGARGREPVGLNARVAAVYALNTVVQLATNTTTEARMKDQAVSEGEPAQPTLTEDEPTRKLPVEEISIDGIRGVY